jgi:hypothetical protein
LNTLAPAAGIHGKAFAKDLASQIEYTWQEDKYHDEFYIE